MCTVKYEKKNKTLSLNGVTAPSEQNFLRNGWKWHNIEKHNAKALIRFRKD